MRAVRLRRPLSAGSFVLFILLAAPPVALPQGGTVEAPHSAQGEASGASWRCARGYERVNDICVAIKVPAN